MAVGALGGGAALAVASVPGSDGTIDGCYQVTTTTGGVTVPATTNTVYTTAPLFRIIDPSQGETCSTARGLTEQTISWSQAGPAGPQGPTGPAGTNGQQGAPGQQGQTGPATTIVSGQTLTLSGGQVIKVGGAAGGVTLAQPAASKNAIGSAELGSGHTGLAFSILGFSLAATSTGGAASGAGAGKVTIKDITVTKRLDQSSPKLFQYCASGKHFPKVTLIVQIAGKGVETIALSNAGITAIQDGTPSGKPQESLTLNFTKIEISYASRNSVAGGRALR